MIQDKNLISENEKDIVINSIKEGKTIPKETINSPLSEGCDFSRGVFKKYKKLPYNPKLKDRAKELRKAGNLSEVLFWNQVKRKQFLSLDFHRQKIIGNYIVDFYCPKLNLIIEIDGDSHNNKVEYDKERDNYLKSVGLIILHFTDIDVKRNLNGVMEYLKEFCGRMNTPSSDKSESTPLQEGNLNTPSLRDTPLQEGNLTKKRKKNDPR
ncbi:MAG: endonuclease domain-containing protein [Candidatus Aenigmarchaeota archaeon]|nr:endonuclease domain-containing protein [Candidatus Aenigmarchaeota archaeon]